MGAKERQFVVDVDGQEVHVPRKRTRKTRNGGVSQETKEKFASVSINRVPLRPMNDKQADYIKAIQEQSCIICIGVWGSSKTYIPSVIASDWLLDKKIDKVIIARPAEGKGKSVGFLKGSKDDKMQPWCAPITDTMKERMGVGNFEAMLANGKIEQLALEHVKGRSWDNCLILVDEAEDLEPEVARSLVGRQGVNSVTVITGDLRQQDLKKNSGLQYLLDVAAFTELPITLIDFDSWDYCVRSEEAKAWGMAFEKFDKR
jgi:phosphate starvation-inducible protein PhoH and related proteins